MKMSFEDTRNGLKFLAKKLSYAKPEDFDVSGNVMDYHDRTNGVSREEGRNAILKMAAELSAMPSPAKFGEYFGIMPKNHIAFHIKAAINRIAAGETLVMDEITKFVIRHLGLSQYDIRYNEKLRANVTIGSIQAALEAYNNGMRFGALPGPKPKPASTKKDPNRRKDLNLRFKKMQLEVAIEGFAPRVPAGVDRARFEAKWWREQKKLEPERRKTLTLAMFGGISLSDKLDRKEENKRITKLIINEIHEENRKQEIANLKQ